MTCVEICAFIRTQFEPQELIPLHRPILGDVEKSALCDCIDSNFVSSVGSRVGEFEQQLSEFSGVRRAVATVNGTAALHIALLCAGVEPGNEVITQPVTFAATVNAISYANASPHFVDVETATLGMSPDSLERFLSDHVTVRGGVAVNGTTGKRLAACVPVHVFGHPCRIDRIAKLCAAYRIPLIEDAAEALGSYRDGVHVGGHGVMATLSFNGNKIITTGGGGAILTNDGQLADRLKHLTTTAKEPHLYEFFHDQIGYNYRLPNLNAALGCVQMDQLPLFITRKRKLAAAYREFFANTDIQFVDEPRGCRSNFWLSAVLFPDRRRRDEFLEYSNNNGVMTRPLWRLMPDLPAFADAPCEAIPVARFLYDRCVALPSSVPNKEIE